MKTYSSSSCSALARFCERGRLAVDKDAALLCCGGHWMVHRRVLRCGRGLAQTLARAPEQASVVSRRAATAASRRRKGARISRHSLKKRSQEKHSQTRSLHCSGRNDDPQYLGRQRVGPAVERIPRLRGLGFQLLSCGAYRLVSPVASLLQHPIAFSLYWPAGAARGHGRSPPAPPAALPRTPAPARPPDGWRPPRVPWHRSYAPAVLQAPSSAVHAPAADRQPAAAETAQPLGSNAGIDRPVVGG